MLIFSLSAPTAAVIGWLFLDETYILQQWLGMLITLSGVCIVIFEKGRQTSQDKKLKVRKISAKGVAFGFGGMIGQAGGYVLSMIGM